MLASDDTALDRVLALQEAQTQTHELSSTTVSLLYNLSCAHVSNGFTVCVCSDLLPTRESSVKHSELRSGEKPVVEFLGKVGG